MISAQLTFTCDLGDGTVATANAAPDPNGAVLATIPAGWQVLSLALDNKPATKYLVCPNHAAATFTPVEDAPVVVALPPVPVPVPAPAGILAPTLAGA